MRRTALGVLAVLALNTAPAAMAADAAAVRAAVDRVIRPLMKEYDVPGLAVGVTVDGQALFFNYGVAARDSGKPVSENTLFELGSVSKTFTALLACHAQNLGRIDFHDHPGAYVPQLKGSPIDRATLLDLGTYTPGGLPLQFPDEVQTDEQAIAYYRQWQPDAPPGTLRRYSNPSIALLGRAAAVGLGTSYGEAVERRLLPALGLRHTYVTVPAGAMADYAWGHNQANKPVRVNRGPFDLEAYGVKSSSADMVRYMQAQIDPSQLPASMRAALDCTHVGHVQVGEMTQGLGWEQYRGTPTLQRLLAGNSTDVSMKPNPAQKIAPTAAPPGTLLNKTGATGGFGSYVVYVPEKKIGVVLLANRNYPTPAKVTAGWKILEALQGQR
ncbi:class C beta-lactamase [Massilia sp. TN1-12]|uniref:class C beta-lactamase n=1 Tax=Massilia paldalensis TaxID=3377675 RepID=UPI00384D17B5